jgi:hypothetical protein
LFDKIGHFSTALPLFSFGVMLWELVARKSTVFPDIDSPYNIALQVIAGKRPQIPDDAPPEFAAMMKDCWQQDPELRPDFEDLEKKLAAYYWSIPEQ